MCILICTSLHCTNSKNKLEVRLVSRHPVHRETEVCNLQFWVLFNPLRLPRFGSETWLWSPVLVASAQTKKRNLQSFSTRLASLILLPSVFSISFQKPWKQNWRNLLMHFYCCGIAEISEGFHWCMLKLHFWWDQALFGHEYGLGQRDVNEREWKLTELNSRRWRANAVGSQGQTNVVGVTIRL